MLKSDEGMDAQIGFCGLIAQEDSYMSNPGGELGEDQTRTLSRPLRPIDHQDLVRATLD